MSAFNPIAAFAAEGTLAASSVAAIDLGVEIAILQSQLTVGDLLSATVLAPQGGSDRLALLGQTVLAQLPPGIDPGESLLLQVTGFSSNQILVQNLGTVDPNDPPPTVSVVLPPVPDGTPQQAVLTTAVPIAPPAAPSAPPAQAPAAAAPAAGFLGASLTGGAPAQAPAPQPPSSQPLSAAVGGAPSNPQPVAPSRAVFVAAAVRAVPVRPDVLRTAAQEPQAVRDPPDPIALQLEARIAATRAAAIDIADLVLQEPVPAPFSREGTPAEPLPSARAPVLTTPLPAASLPLEGSRRAARTPPVLPEQALLARLRVPALPVTIAAAKLGASAASVLPKVFARLGAALSEADGQDPRVGTLRAALAFVQRLDPSNTRALPEQLAAFVSHVVDGAESKLVALLQLLEQPAPPAPAQPSAAPPSGAAATETPDMPAPAGPLAVPAQAEEPAGAASQPPMIVSAAAQAAERSLALQYDAKASIVSMIEAPPRGAPAELAPALSNALTVMTAVQLNVLSSLRSENNAVTIPLPVFFHEGGRPVQLRIDRDAPRGGKLDADDFHIAFVLDTASLGTVAVDVQTVGRAVSINVKTQEAPAAERFRTTLGDLRERLETMRYRVANAVAAIAPHLRLPERPNAHADSTSEAASAKGPRPLFDLQA